MEVRVARAPWLFLVAVVTSCGGRSLTSDDGTGGSGEASVGHSEQASGGAKVGGPTGGGGSSSNGRGGTAAGMATQPPDSVSGSGGQVMEGAHVEVPHGSYRIVELSADEGDGNFWEETQTIDAVDITVESGVGALAVFNKSGELVGAGVTSCVAPRVGVPERLRVPAEFPTIQAALDAASSFDIVEVAAGTYREHLVARGPVTLLGAGAGATFLDGDGEAASILDVSRAYAAVVAGFTFRNAGQKSGCADPDDPGACSGNWYSAAVYVSGDGVDLTCPPSLLFFHNAVAASHMGLFVNFHARVIATNNLFYGNRYAFVANHHQDAALLANNVFYDSDGLAIFGQASYLSLINNIVLGGPSAFEKMYVQSGFVGCNVVFGSDPGSIQSPIVLDPAFVNAPGGDFRLSPDSPVRGRGCLGGPLHDPSDDPGAYGGPLGNW
ncbi:MAG: hypothetical protein ABUL60_00705 [Myxococcales bacterium]